jgi:hypothetical protein
VKLGKYLLIALLAVSALLFGPAQSAFAAQFKLAPHSHYWAKKNFKAHGLKQHKPKKLRNSKSRFRSPVTGNMLYGKPVKQK